MPGVALGRGGDLLDLITDDGDRLACGRGGEGIAVDYVGHFVREVAAFEAARGAQQ
jgi:hypothetical protein